MSGASVFLGVNLDPRLTWKRRVGNITEKCDEMSGRVRMGCRCSLTETNLYSINPDDGCVAYGSAAKSVLSDLLVIQAQALMICVFIPAQEAVDGQLLHMKGHDDGHLTKRVLEGQLAEGESF